MRVNVVLLAGGDLLRVRNGLLASTRPLELGSCGHLAESDEHRVRLLGRLGVFLSAQLVVPELMLFGYSKF